MAELALASLQTESFDPIPRWDPDEFRQEQCFFKCLMPNKLVTAIMGEGCKTQAALESEHNVKILISEPTMKFMDTSERVMVVGGSEDDIENFLEDFCNAVNALALDGYKDVLRDRAQGPSKVSGEDPQLLVKVIVPREGIKPLLGQNQTIETNDCLRKCYPKRNLNEHLPYSLVG